MSQWRSTLSHHQPGAFTVNVPSGFNPMREMLNCSIIHDIKCHTVPYLVWPRSPQPLSPPHQYLPWKTTAKKLLLYKRGSLAHPTTLQSYLVTVNTTTTSTYGACTTGRGVIYTLWLKARGCSPQKQNALCNQLFTEWFHWFCRT